MNQKNMTVLELLRQQFRYDSWANREELRVLSTLPAPSEPATKLLTHIIAAQWLWFDRLQGNQPRTAVWPDMALAMCETQLLELDSVWRSYLGKLSEADLAKACSYTNSKGDAFSSNVLDILNQLILHAAHHRGQISQEIRRSGATPAPVDYIHAVRKGLIG
ncbi:MAG TPA: DinB family protein [Terriglobales bacterium]